MKLTDTQLDKDRSLSNEQDDLRPQLRAEANLAVIPWVLSKRNLSSQSKHEILFEYSELVDGVLAKKKILVSMASKQKNGETIRETLPTQFDHDVFSCVVDLWHEQGESPDGKAEFQTSDICKRLLINHQSGKNRTMVNESLQRLSRINIESHNAFYSAVLKKRIDKHFKLFSLESIFEGEKRTSPNRRHRIFLDQMILGNLEKSYSLELNRISYQTLENFFSKRLFNLVAYREQIDGHREVFDFDLNYLAEFLPISGVTYSSQVKAKLAKSLLELKTKKVFSHDFVKQGKMEVLRLYSEFKSPDFVRIEDVKKFVGIIYEYYGKSVQEILEIDEDDIRDLVKKDTRPLYKIQGANYNLTFYVLHLMYHQYINKTITVKKSKYATLSNLLKKNFQDLNIPLGFKPLHKLREQLREKLKEKEIKVEDTFLHEVNKREKYIHETAQVYAKKLTEKQKQQYILDYKNMGPFSAKLLKDHGEKSPLIEEVILQLIKNDLRNGKDIELMS
jgi:hypothetical protein